jgi:hypothetical protein
MSDTMTEEEIAQKVDQIITSSREMVEAIMPTLLNVYKAIMDCAKSIATAIVQSYPLLFNPEELEATFKKANMKERHRKRYERMYARGSLRREKLSSR